MNNDWRVEFDDSSYSALLEAVDLVFKQFVGSSQLASNYTTENKLASYIVSLVEKCENVEIGALSVTVKKYYMNKLEVALFDKFDMENPQSKVDGERIFSEFQAKLAETDN